MAYTFLLRNTPAFAFCTNYEGSSSCVLHIKHSESCGEASIYLNFLIHVRGFEEPQPFQLAYDADNWKALGLFPVNRGLDEHQLARIRWRNTRPVAMTLTLDLHHPCTVQSLASTGCIAAKPGHESHFDQLRQLASAITVDLLFDIHYLNQNHAAFLQLISRSRDLTGVPAKAYNGPLTRKTDWTVFSPIEDDVHSAPPSYAAASTKPSRPGKWRQLTSIMDSSSPAQARAVCRPRGRLRNVAAFCPRDPIPHYRRPLPASSQAHQPKRPPRQRHRPAPRLRLSTTHRNSNIW